MSNEWIEQTLPLRYLDDDTLEKDLDRILGEEGWKPSKTELHEIETNAKNHYLQSREAAAVMGQNKS
ncbi:hypothetical protein Daus18300_000616 [Diaporthe australafricana]|uniref:Uncharacterized protein n=1 Tax=Diaporthe australafricana TaxID=127596 RepID=A0ABR3Y4J9_9PEZI